MFFLPNQSSKLALRWKASNVACCVNNRSETPCRWAETLCSHIVRHSQMQLFKQLLTIEIHVLHLLSPGQFWDRFFWKILWLLLAFILCCAKHWQALFEDEYWVEATDEICIYSKSCKTRILCLCRTSRMSTRSTSVMRQSMVASSTHGRPLGQKVAYSHFVWST